MSYLSDIRNIRMNPGNSTEFYKVSKCQSFVIFCNMKARKKRQNDKGSNENPPALDILQWLGDILQSSSENESDEEIIGPNESPLQVKNSQNSKYVTKTS